MSTLESDFREWMKSASARSAFDFFIRHGSSLKEFDCRLEKSGESKKVYSYNQGSVRPFAFIVNKSHLLFYFRKAGLSNAAADIDTLSRRFSEVKRNNLDEIIDFNLELSHI